MRLAVGLVVLAALTSSGCGASSPPPAPPPVPQMPPPAVTVPPGALAVVLDRSGSMMGAKLEAAREAAHQSVDRLRDDDEIAIIAFDTQAKLVVPLGRPTNRPLIHAQIDSIQPGGGTYYDDALELATEELAHAGPKTRHVLFLTDGLAPTEGVDALVEGLNRIGATLSTIGLGADTDPVLLGRMASLGGGRTWSISDPTKLAGAFREDLATYLRR